MRPVLPAALLAFAAAMTGWPGPVTAQVVDGWGWTVIIPSVTGTDHIGLHLRELARQRDNGGEAPDPAANAPQATMPDPAVLRYTPSKTRRTANLARFVEQSRRIDPAGAASLQTLFASGDIIDRIGAQLAPHGLRVDDLADTYAVWWITAWQATRGSNAETSDRTNMAVRAQAARALVGIGTIAQASDAAKQELAESLLIQTMLIDAAVEQAKGNPSQLAAVGAAAGQGARGMGLDLSTMDLTEQGFVIGAE